MIPASSAKRVAVVVLLLLTTGGGARGTDAAATATPSAQKPLHLPWREAGWSERAAAAIVLDRLSYGARPGEIDRVVALGVDRWVELQLAALSRPQPEPRELGAALARLPALASSSSEIVARYPPNPILLRRAEQAGVIDRGRDAGGGGGEPGDRRAERRKLEAWMAKEGLRPEGELLAQVYAQKLLRAVLAEAQLRELLVDFWFNHFNVSVSDNAVRVYLLGYERDAIRAQVGGKFRDLLEATAKHPAMLAYLDNFQSVANEGQPTLVAERDDADRFARPGGARGGRGLGQRTPLDGMREPPRTPRSPRSPDTAPRPNRPQGLNENYARELLELHTLGVDGGYTQKDVVEVARAFTGWAFVPPGGIGGGAILAGRDGRRGRAQLGVTVEGDFLFRGSAHDAAAKTVLGRTLPAGRGLADGEEVLDLVARHPATARHLATKLAARFVGDDPPAALVDRLAAAFTATGGDLAALVRTLVESPEFWAPAARGAKIKSPFELATSALRGLGATVENPFPIVGWISRMGQTLYAYQAPTGFPDRADFWVNTGALLARMNFGLELAAGRVGGVRFDFAVLTGGQEPESASVALARFAELLLPERDRRATLAELEPLLARPELSSKVAARADDAAPPSSDDALGDFADLAPAMEEEPARAGARGAPTARDAADRLRQLERFDLYPAARAMHGAADSPSVLAGVAGLLLGSPEFQRRF